MYQIYNTTALIFSLQHVPYFVHAAKFVLFQFQLFYVQFINSCNIGGALVGYVTNWIALKWIFEPLNPLVLGPFILQGMFLKRQKEVGLTEIIWQSESLFLRFSK